MRFGKKGIGAVASITAAAALLTCLVPVALADNGGGGSGEGGGGDHGGPSQTADVHWIYKDSWPATLDGMKSALRDANVTLSSDLSDGANEYVDMNKTLSDAIDECRRSIRVRETRTVVWWPSDTPGSGTACSMAAM